MKLLFAFAAAAGGSGGRSVLLFIFSNTGRVSKFDSSKASEISGRTIYSLFPDKNIRQTIQHNKDMNSNLPNIQTEEDSLGSLLELAANNDLPAFKDLVDRHPSIIDSVGPWYSRQKGSSQMALHHLTPLMVAATYGSLDVLKLIVSSPEVDVNRHCGPDKSTALHCAASGGSPDSPAAVRLLLAAGADPNLTDADGRRPIDVIFVPPKSHGTKCTLQLLLATDDEENEPEGPNSPVAEDVDDKSGRAQTPGPERKEYPVDPSLPDIKNSIYSTDEFRMFSFKVRPCSRAYSHDWTECPFVHPGENARRRDPRKYHYSCVPCPEFRKGSCRRGDMCEYAHGVFECWLHPAQYRTRLCKDGPGCGRRVCFFAHAQDELRPLYVSTGSAVPSPRSSVDFPFNPPSPFTPPISPSAVAAAGGPWGAPANLPPPLHLPGSGGGGGLQSSRLRSSLNARDIHDELDLLGRASFGGNALIMPSNLEDVFSAEGGLPSSSSPRFADFSHSQFQQKVLSPVKTALLSPRNIDHSLMLSPRKMDPGSPASARMAMLARQENERFRSLSSRDLGSGVNWSNWGPAGHNGSSSSEWALGGMDQEVGGRLKRSSSFDLMNDEEEPDLSWVQSLVKESPQELKEKSVVSRLAGNGGGASSSSGGGAVVLSEQIEEQSVLGAWLEQMQLDQLMAQ
ncbi:zinc finger CCCH domain-containing protein [Striga asiatica]|uniref:Zinc finger CCCH domain-containing protein n=1 Tax=Striga asiatica TaxID=4170 RepID=A0A5A7NZD2_STRAF|nr:zinc finger CCCH domain-containing protein [Striga asiatica]